MVDANAQKINKELFEQSNQAAFLSAISLKTDGFVNNDEEII